MSDPFIEAFDAPPNGSFEGLYGGRRWIIQKTHFAKGRSQKIVAHELGGAGYISANLYSLGSGPALKPCEMPAAKVHAFVLGLCPI